MNWIIFFIGWIVGFLCSNIIVKYMMHKAEKGLTLMMYDLQKKRNIVQEDIANNLSFIVAKLYGVKANSEDK